MRASAATHPAVLCALIALSLGLGAGLTGCVPYVVGTTAQPVPVGEWSSHSSAYAIPNGVNPEEEGAPEGGASFFGIDSESRLGLDEHSDLGIRVPGGVGVVVNYKRRVLGGPDGPALALMGGGGFINLANNAHLELTAIVSGREPGLVTPYGGLRAMQSFPLSDEFPSDDPTLGGFAGLRLGGDRAVGVSVEMGVFYDPSATGIRQNDWIVVPSISLHGRGIGRLLPF